MASPNGSERYRRRVLIALDGSDASREAFNFAVAKVLHRSKDSLLLLHVLASAHNLEDVENYLQEFKELAEAHVLEAQTLTVPGDARHAIVTTAEKEAVDLLIVGSHGKGVAKRLILGSVSDYCVHNAPCPVLVHRPGTKS